MDEIFIFAEGPKDHHARSGQEGSTMTRRGMHPLLMGLDKPDRKIEDKPLERPDSQMTGLESPQHKRFLRAEAEEKTQAEAG